MLIGFELICAKLKYALVFNDFVTPQAVDACKMACQFGSCYLTECSLLFTRVDPVKTFEGTYYDLIGRGQILVLNLVTGSGLCSFMLYSSYSYYH